MVEAGDLAWALGPLVTRLGRDALTKAIGDAAAARHPDPDWLWDGLTRIAGRRAMRVLLLLEGCVSCFFLALDQLTARGLGGLGGGDRDEVLYGMLHLLPASHPVKGDVPHDGA